MMTNTLQLDKMARQLFSNNTYLGTFPINQVPTKRFNHNRLQHFIINTQTSNLPGQHWIAVSLHQRRAYVFDPFGQPPPSLLIQQLLQHGGIQQIYYNTKQVQPINSQICGQLALQHLHNVSNLRGGIRRLSYWKAFVH